MKNDRIIAFAAGAAGLVIAGSATSVAIAALAQEAEAPATQAATPPVVDAAAVTALVEQINARLAELPADAKTADIEAQILFAIDQAQAPADVVAAALAQVTANNSNAVVLAALQNVKALQGRLASGTGGTGGLNDNSGLEFGPSINGSGGGSTDYTPTA